MQIGFIGVGKIAAALVEGFCTATGMDVTIHLSPRNEANGIALAEKYPQVRREASNQAVLAQADVVFIAVRPAVVAEVLAGLAFRERHTVISLVPLLKYERLAILAAPAATICRAVPLPPVALHQCPVPVYRPTDAVLALLGQVGQPLPVANEQQLHAIWTLTGLITPFYNLLGELADWTVAQGVDKGTANRYVADLFGSLSHMAQQSRPVDFAALASHAATPNGMNEQAGREIRENGAHDSYVAACDHLLERFK